MRLEMDSVTGTVRIPVFAGIGTSVANSPQYRETAIADASSSLGSLLLSSCYHAFTTELVSLTATELAFIDIDLAVFSSQLSLLSLSSSRSPLNPVISNSFLFLAQSLRYLACTESLISRNDVIPFFGLLQTNADLNIGILGFSLGLLSACVAATSTTALVYINHAVEMYKLTIWMGIRVQIHRIRTLAGTHIFESSWSHVLAGMGKEDAASRLASFNEQVRSLRLNKGIDSDKFTQHNESPLYLTAVLNAKSVTISGRPDTLQLFLTSINQNLVSITATHVDALYHAYPAHLPTRIQVLSDIKRRNIIVPTASELIVPLVSTFNGEQISSSSTPLVEAIIDMILTQPVNWDLVTTSIAERLVSAHAGDVELVSIGPGESFTMELGKVLSSRNMSVKVFDIPTRAPRNSEPIAIVGMAVNMPGSPNIEELWNVLENGINMVSKVWCCYHSFSITLLDTCTRFPNLVLISSLMIPPTPMSLLPVGSMRAPGTSCRTQLPLTTNSSIYHPVKRKIWILSSVFFYMLPTKHSRMRDTSLKLPKLSNGRDLGATLALRRMITWSISKTKLTYITAQVRFISSPQLLVTKSQLYFIGTLRSFLSGRISYAMQWSGPSITVDTACSSSLVAIYQACRALENRDCNAALAGGVNVIAGPDVRYSLRLVVAFNIFKTSPDVHRVG